MLKLVESCGEWGVVNKTGQLNTHKYNDTSLHSHAFRS